jgi:arylsulfatase A-like enzyme
VTAKPNIVVVVSDTLRAGHVGCYGSDRIQTPNLDAFAAESVRFARAYPESLPTIPVRRALHTGRRAYPFRDYRPVKWDIVYLPGWQAMDNEEDTLAENLAAAGYQTGFVTDTLPYFAPGFNFQRGFWQWEYIRGQQQDRWRSPFAVSDERLRRYGDLQDIKKNMHALVPMHLANTARVRSEEDTTTARTFQWAMDFLDDNAERGEPFYLLVDCFDPHEPWEAPEDYYRMYGDAGYSGRRIVHCGYGPAEWFGYTPEEIAYVENQYCGLVTLVDAWFGRFLRKLRGLGLERSTAVFFISDHGTNFCRNPRNVIGKPADAMYPGVMHLPFIAKLPGAPLNGSVCNELVYNIDLPATICDLAGVASADGIDGQSLTPLLTGEGAWQRREYVTCRYAHSLCYIDEKGWFLTDLDGTPQEFFDLEADPACRENIVEKAGKKRLDQAWDRLLHDAGGDLPDYRAEKQTDAIGQKVTRQIGKGV